MSSPEELRPFLRTVRRRRITFQGRPAWNFQGPGFTGLALLAGMGGAAPPELTARALVDHPADVVVAAGFGGALTPLPPPAGLLVADACWRLDPAGALSPVAFSPPAPPAALASLLQARGLTACTGALVTTPSVLAKTPLLPRVAQLANPVLDLETAAIADVAHIRGLPLLALRAITDGAGEDIQVFLADIINRHRGVPLFRLLPALAASPRRVGYCLHLWQRSFLAGRHLAQALNLILEFLTRQ